MSSTRILLPAFLLELFQILGGCYHSGHPHQPGSGISVGVEDVGEEVRMTERLYSYEVADYFGMLCAGYTRD
ncbi:MAG: hypothetical protein ABSG45_03765 [Nitrososphaerales archaeon]